jgi:hypothetical protein
MKMNIVFAILLLLGNCGAFAASGAGAPIQSQTSWTNQRGSTLYVTHVNPRTGQITGSFINRANGFHCENKPYPMTGWFSGNAVTFSVNWESKHAPNCKSTTAWTGFVSGDKMPTRWQLIADGATDLKDIATEDDLFTLDSESSPSKIKK